VLNCSYAGLEFKKFCLHMILTLCDRQLNHERSRALIFWSIHYTATNIVSITNFVFLLASVHFDFKETIEQHIFRVE